MTRCFKMKLCLCSRSQFGVGGIDGGGFAPAGFCPRDPAALQTSAVWPPDYKHFPHRTHTLPHSETLFAAERGKELETLMLFSKYNSITN